MPKVGQFSMPVHTLCPKWNDKGTTANEVKVIGSQSGFAAVKCDRTRLFTDDVIACVAGGTATDYNQIVPVGRMGWVLIMGGTFSNTGGIFDYIPYNIVEKSNVTIVEWATGSKLPNKLTGTTANTLSASTAW